MYLKIHRSEREILVAVCDKEILGAKLVDGSFAVKLNEEFYKGDLVDENVVIDALKSATTANIFGEKAINCAIKCKVINQNNIIEIDGVPHAQLFRV
ncbi:DUF424 domain-containing protein [Methanosalsum natronophilum]|uniref:DUF424 family protein n=1 Tax=Methanosalsum natronophilum TaxID=768733 RepID=A0A3R7XUV2_9EURY|nr:DUF424 family protein [Methanosalsum natronophilum]MCS3922964.1 hypothetical protein [Methanosalsum natronophilum]RQD86230.1 MAG: DUF424 family protein [Methanosalsum natronophilum]